MSTSDSRNVFFLDDSRRLDPSNELKVPEWGTEEFHSHAQGIAKRLQEHIEAAKKKALHKATPIVLFQVSYGRNAWHSTWISRYVKQTLLPSWQDATRLISVQRTQGSSYRLTVMPGWHLDFGSARFVVAEINTSRPFERLIEPGFAHPGISKQRALDLLNPSSTLWKGNAPRHDSVIVQETESTASDYRLWHNRTHSPTEKFSPGRYKRRVSGSRWWMAPVLSDYDTSFFEASLSALED